MKLQWVVSTVIGATLVTASAHAEDWVVLKASPRECRTITALNENTVICAPYNNSVPSWRGEFAITKDGGDTWAVIKGPVTVPIYKDPLYWHDANTAFLSLSPSKKTDLLWKTADGGKTWSAKSLAVGVDNLQLYGAHCAGSTCYVGGRRVDPATGKVGALLARSTDAGDTWTEVNTLGPTVGSPMFVASVWAMDAMTVVVQANNMTLRSTDGGATWTPSGTASSTILGELKFFDATRGVLADAALFATADGLSWTPLTVPKGATGKPSPAMRAIDFLSPEYAIAGMGYNNSGFQGDIGRTVDGTKTWTYEPLPAGWAAAPTSVAAPSTKVSYASSGFIGTGPSVIRWGTPSGTTSDAGVDAATPDVGMDASATADTSVADAPTTTDDSGVAETGAPAAATEDGGGCSVSTGTRDSSGATLAALALAAVLWQRRGKRSHARSYV